MTGRDVSKPGGVSRLAKLLGGGEGDPAEPAIAALFAAGEPERRVAAAFSAGLRFEGGAPITDTPLMLLCFTNRSGSNLLREYLRSTGEIIGMAEMLNPPTVRNQAQKKGFSSLPDYIAHHAGRAEAGQIFGMKAADWQLAMLLRARVPAMFGGGVKLVQITRTDRLGQAVSHVIADQTKQWTSAHKGERVEPVYDRAAITRHLLAAARQNEAITQMAAIAGLGILQVTYEQITGAPAGVVQQIGGFVGRDLSGWAPPEAVAIERQANEVNADFIARYRAESAQAVGIGP